MQSAFLKIALPHSNSPIRLYCIGDFHIGHINHDAEKLEKIKKEIIADPHAYVIIMGDNVDGRQPDHKFFDLDNLAPDIKLSRFINNCYKKFEDFVIDVSPKVLGIHIGNHELEVNKVAPYVENICSRRSCSFLGYRALSCLVVSSNRKECERSYRIFSTHGSGAGRKTGAKINRIEDEASSNNCDIFIQGHNHLASFSTAVLHEPYIFDNKIRIREMPQVFVNSGSFLKSYQLDTFSYAEKSSYKPLQTGCVMVELYARSGLIRGHILT